MLSWKRYIPCKVELTDIKVPDYSPKTKILKNTFYWFMMLQFDKKSNRQQ